MRHSRRRSSLSIAALIALAATIFGSTIVAAPAFAAAGYVGSTNGTDSANWRDVTIAPMTVDEPYNDSVQVPAGWGGYFNESSTDLPDGLAVSLGVDGTMHITGTPTTADASASFSLGLAGSDGASFGIMFSGVVVDGGLPATVTTASTPDVSPHSAVEFEASVTGDNPTGTVTFLLNGATVATEPLNAGVATYTGPVSSNYIGLSVGLTAVYSGDGGNAASTSLNDYVYIYGSATATGTVSENGAPLETTVELLSMASLVVDSTTSVGGTFQLEAPAPTTVGEVAAQYYIRAQTSAGYVYYSPAGGPGQPNVTSMAAISTGVNAWVSALPIFHNVAPVWSDSVLAQPRLASTYSDSVVATGTATLGYSVSAGVLPAGLSLNAVTGAITGIPTDQVPQTFTLRAANAYGAVTHIFTLTPGDAGVAPTFSDESLAAPTEGAAYNDAVLATGDPTIVYSSHALPAGLVLNPTTGTISGTPTTPGAFSAELTATNEFGSDTFTWAGVVAVAPEIALELEFAAGTKVGDASTEISAGGLLVGSTYTLDLHSDPIRLYTGTIDATGGFTHTVTLPANTPVGAHMLVLTGTAPDGTVLTARAWFTLLPNGTIGAVSYSGAIPFALAAAGTDSLPLLALGAAAVLGGVLVLRRRRTTEV